MLERIPFITVSILINDKYFIVINYDFINLFRNPTTANLIDPPS